MRDLRRLRRAVCGMTAGLLLVSCGSDDSAPVRPEITPQDFALVPCGPGLAEQPCALVVAGGKRVLFGAPAGVAATLTQEDLRGLDAVMLFSLRAVDIEGLDEVRNETWWAGRDEPLLVAGPEGTTQLVEALNKAFEQSDALRVVEEGIPKGGYDAAVLVGSNVGIGERPFDTGDFDITAKGTGNWDMGYGSHGDPGVGFVISSCNSDSYPDGESLTPVDFHGHLGCQAAHQYQWPLTETVFIVKK